MLTVKRVGLMGALAGALVLVMSPPVNAHSYSDQASSVLVWPKIVVKSGDSGSMDTLIQMTSVNPGSEVNAHCVYVNANSHCTNNGRICASALDCIDSDSAGACEPGWIETDFDVTLTAEQPLAWSASYGLAGPGPGDPDDLANGRLPCAGANFFGIKCPNFESGPIGGGTIDEKQSNAGTMVPPVGEVPFIGELKCIQADEATRRPFGPCGDGAGPCPGDYLTGTATIQRLSAGGLDAAQYNAVGLKGAGRNDGNGVLEIGGPPESAEYTPCPRQLVLDHLFDGAFDPIEGNAQAQTELTLVPCTQDFRLQTLEPVTAMFLIYNEFEQRYSTTRRVDCLLDSPLSRIDTTQPTRSVFHAAVTGTIVGQTFIDTVGGGLLGTAILKYLPVENGNPDAPTLGGVGSAAYNLVGMNERIQEGDRITIP